MDKQTTIVDTALCPITWNGWKVGGVAQWRAFLALLRCGEFPFLFAPTRSDSYTRVEPLIIRLTTRWLYFSTTHVLHSHCNTDKCFILAAGSRSNCHTCHTEKIRTSLSKKKKKKKRFSMLKVYIWFKRKLCKKIHNKLGKYVSPLLFNSGPINFAYKHGKLSCQCIHY